MLAFRMPSSQCSDETKLSLLLTPVRASTTRGTSGCLGRKKARFMGSEDQSLVSGRFIQGCVCVCVYRIKIIIQQ